MANETPTRRIFRALLALTVAASVVTAAEAWKKKPASEWTQEEARAVLDDSPWGQRVMLLQSSGRMLARLGDGRKVVYQEAPGRAPRQFSVEPVALEPELVQANYAVRWSSAGIVQQALARLKEIAPVLEEMQAPPVELSAEHYVVTARVAAPPRESRLDALERPLTYNDEMGRPAHDPPPTVGDIFAGLSAEELRERAELRRAGQLRLKPDRVLRHGVGAGEGISFFFPRQQNGQATLPAGTQWVEFAFTSQKDETLKVRFKPAVMQVNGQPDW